MKVKLNRFLILFAFCGTTLLFGQTPVTVPVTISERIEKVGNSYYHLHTVEKGQTLYSIARTYQVAVSEITRTSDKPEIQIGELLMIPTVQKPLQTQEVPVVDTSAPPARPLENYTFRTVDTIRTEFTKPAKTVLNVALMLPLYLNEVDEIRINPRDRRTVPKPFTFITFYEGALLAAQSLADQNTQVNVQVFDVTDDLNTAVRLINSGKLEEIDVIIGPLFSRSFKAMSDYAKQRNIFIINPISDRNDILLDNPYVIKITPSGKNQLQSLLTHVTKNTVRQEIFILSNDSLPNEKERSEQAKIFFETQGSHLKTPVFIDISKDRFQKFSTLLSDTKRNTIIYLSNNEAFVTEILAQISKRENASDVLYCLQKLAQIEFTEIRYLNDLQTHYADPFFVNYNSEKVKDFEHLFYSIYHTIPDRNAYLGYDVMKYVLTMLEIGNTSYGNHLEATPYKGFHNTIRLQRDDPSQGLENRETNILKIESSHLKKMNN